MKDKKLFWNQR